MVNTEERPLPPGYFRTRGHRHDIRIVSDYINACPFCGSPGFVSEYETPKGIFFKPRCTRCMALVECRCETMEQAVDIWNRRV